MTTSHWNKPIKIDSFLTLPCRVMLSPMEGVMRPVFCAAANELDLVPYWMTPFFSISRDSVPPVKFFRKNLLPYGSSPLLIVQLLGHDPDSLAEAAVRLGDLPVQGINLNFACPSATVNASGNGAALLKDLKRAEDIIRRVQQAVGHKLSVSVKVRCGWEDPSEIPQIAALINRCGVPWVICHYRTAAEKYQPVPGGWQRLKEFRSLLNPSTVFFGNGDIVTADHAEQMLRETRCHGVAVGRAFLQNPFLLKRLKDGVAEVTASAQEQDRILFFKTLLSLPQKYPALAEQWSRNSFLECCRMAFGRDSRYFRELAGMSLEEIRESLAKRDEEI